MKFPATLLLSFAFTVAACHGQEKDNKPSPIGYEDTPIIPGTEWRVHDIKRPAPPVVTPGKTNDDAPADAVIIFNGGGTDALVAKEGKPCPWKVENGELLIQGGDCWTKEQFGSCQLHIEWMSAPNTKGNSQKKGNAGVFFMDRYECQMMDNDNNPTYADGMTGSIYGQTPPLANAVRKAGEWQTYDIIFTAPKLKDGKVVEPAYVTTFVNGVCVQVHTQIMGPTKHKNITSYDGDFPEKAPIRLQDHKNDPPVRVRNYWVRPLP